MLLAGLGLAVYSNSFQTPFVYDGVPFIVQNASLRQLNPLKFTDGRERPVAYFTFALNYALDGYRVWGYHAVNLAIHVAAAWTLFGLLRRTLQFSPRCPERFGGSRTSTPSAWLGGFMSSAGGFALAVAALWLVHPLQTASVTYVYQRQESLMGLLYLLTLYCVLRGIQASHPDDSAPRDGRRNGYFWYAGAVACSLLGMGTKEVMVTAPLMTVWYDRVFWARSWRELLHRRGLLYALLAATAAVPVAVVLLNKAKYQSVGLLVHEVYSPWEYALSQPGVICHYLWLCFDPRGLCIDPNWPVATSADQIVGPALFIGLLLGLTAWCVWRRPAWGFVGGWFFVILAPTSSVVPILDLAYDHRMYLSLAAVLLVVVMGLQAVWHRLARWSPAPLFRRTWLPAAVTAAVVVVFGAQTLLRNQTYHSAAAIWYDAVEKAPHNPRAHYSFARELHEAGDRSPQTELEALAEVNVAIELVARTGHDRVYVDARTLRGTILERLAMNADLQGRAAAAEGQVAWLAGDFDEVARCADEARLCWSDTDRWFEEAETDLRCGLELEKDKAEAWNNLGNLFARKLQMREAVECYDRAIAVDPRSALAWKNRGSARMNLGQLPEAVRDLRQAIALDGTQASFYYMLALAQAAEGDAPAGVRTLEQAAGAGAANADTYSALGTLLVTCDRPEEARQAFQRSLTLDPEHIASLMNLADLLAKTGRQREAADCYRRVLSFSPDHRAARELLARLPPR